MSLPVYPVTRIRTALLKSLDSESVTILKAPPGTGKSTLIPLFLAEGMRGAGQIWLLQPRRAAVRAVAQRMRCLAGDELRIGWMTRDERDVPDRARIVVMTEGIFVRRIIDDPELNQVSAVILDEFHERSLQVDMSFVLARQAQELFAPHVRLLIMSATLDAGWAASLRVPLLTVEGTLHEVAEQYKATGVGAPAGERIEESAADAAFSEVVRILAEGGNTGGNAGGVLVFLPGEGEIRRCVTRLADLIVRTQDAGKREAILVLPLYGRQSSAEQQLAIEPAAAGKVKIVVATNVAETSLTIGGISCVVDSGLRRRRVFEPSRGIGRMVTDRISRASAIQRAGRAGRLGPGRVVRLWPETEQLREFDPPEIATAELSDMLLHLAAWGDINPDVYEWPDRPDAERVRQSHELLRELRAVDESGVITGRGRALQKLPLDVRLASMVLGSADGAEAARLAALLSEGDPLTREAARHYGADLGIRLELVRQSEARSSGDGLREVRRAAARHIRRESERILRELERLNQKSRMAGAGDIGAIGDVGELTARAYPDRVGMRTERGTYVLRGGGEFGLREGESGFAPGWLAAADVQRTAGGGVIHLAAALSEASVENVLRDSEVVDRVLLEGEQLRARRVRCLGRIVLSETPMALKDVRDVARSAGELVAEHGTGALGWSAGARRLQERLLFLRAHGRGAGWPDVSEAALSAAAGEWLPGFLSGRLGPGSLSRVDMRQVLLSRVPWELQGTIDELAPESVRLPSGSRQKLRYEGDRCVLSARIQQLFGMMESPRAAGEPVEVELLSPARRPVQVTRDLASFWRSTYGEVRKELRGRYPRHYWPEDPGQAEPTDRVRPR